jgi:tetratricopeptide (TPR) repeat protein/DNA-binding CsgD family transcriptional regulator
MSSPEAADAQALAPLLAPSAPLALQVHRGPGPVVGREIELAAIGQELAAAAGGRLAGLTVEGEPGIGKTRLLVAGIDMARERRFTTVAVVADEELRGPFLLARSILGAPEAVAAAEGTAAADALARALNAMSGLDDPSLATLSPDAKLLRTYDLGAVAIRELATRRPLALFVDDLQWGDDDSLRLLRYIVRAASTAPILLMCSIRPEELALVTEAVNLLADMERAGLVRRLRIDRFTQFETRELLHRVLGGPVEPSSAASMHAQAEGVPFIVEEMAHAYRDAAMVQEIDGVWTLAGNADRLVPSAVRTLISRRAARLPAETKASLAPAAILGRRFSLKDLAAVNGVLGEGETDPAALADALAPAASAGLLRQHAEGSAADYSFPHEQIREFAAAELTAPRRRSIHAAIVQLLTAGTPAPESASLLAHHAKAAGDADVCVRFSLAAADNAVAANAPEEALRMVEIALPLAASAQERIGLLEARDRALDMLRRPTDRMEGLAELAALAEAQGDSTLELDVRLRRAAALRSSEEEDRAAQVARKVRELAASRREPKIELAACIELGQALMRTAAGESFIPPEREVDADAVEEAYLRAAELARELGDDASLATALRELGVIELGRLRTWFVERFMSGEIFPIVARTAAGEPIQDVLSSLPVAPTAEAAQRRFAEALEIFERIGDRRGAMSTIIAMGFLSWAPDIHFGAGSARHIEEIRRLTSRMKAFTNESERASFEAQMLYGVHLFSRAKAIPDLAISRGELAHRTAKEIGDHALEFLAAGGTALAYLDVGELEDAERWLETASAVARDHPTPLRARRMESWRGRLHEARGEVDEMRRHLERAVELASERGQAAARCEALAQLALACGRVGVQRGDQELVDMAERAAHEVAELMPGLPGHPPWGAAADASLGLIALSRDQPERAEAAALAAMGALEEAKHEDPYLEILQPIAAVLRSTDSEAWPMAREFLQMFLALIGQRTLDEEMRVKWFRGPVGRPLIEVVGPIEVSSTPRSDGGVPFAEEDATLLRSLVLGRTNEEIAEELGLDEQAVSRRLGELFATIGASSRAEATAFAFRQRVV